MECGVRSEELEAQVSHLAKCTNPCGDDRPRSSEDWRITTAADGRGRPSLQETGNLTDCTKSSDAIFQPEFYALSIVQGTYSAAKLELGVRSEIQKLGIGRV